MNAQMLLQSFAGGEEEKTYIEDVFSTYLYAGNGSIQTINNGIDLAGKGGMVWTKTRGVAYAHNLYSTALGTGKHLSSDSPVGVVTDAATITAFNSNGFSVGADDNVQYASGPGVSWTFRNSPKFFKCATVVKSAGSNATVDLSSLGTVGMVTVKRTDSTGDWYTWHRSLPAGQLMYLSQTAAAATLGHITVSGTTLTLVNGVIADGSYVVYAWAHDPSPNGLVQCGSFTTDTSGNATVTTGWEPQFVIAKCTSSPSSWRIVDSARGNPTYSSGVSNQEQLLANLSNAAGMSLGAGHPTATGFIMAGQSPSETLVYLAIRRGPMRVPTDGTKVFKPLTRTGTGAAATVTGVGFAPDLVVIKQRTDSLPQGRPSLFSDRLRGSDRALYADQTSAEDTSTYFVRGFLQDGVLLDAGGSVNTATNGATYINHFFRRAPGVFDVVCYTGTGVVRTVAHNLGVAPQLLIVKGRMAVTSWPVLSTAIQNTEYLTLGSTAAVNTSNPDYWNSAYPTATSFSVGTNLNTNGTGQAYVAYLFATLPGISKVGSYIGNGTSQTIDCGFSTGARFILVKSVDAAGDWFIWDTARGIVAANDPHLSLNTTAAEVTTDDSVDPYVGGFIVNQNTATNINIAGKRYIFLAIA